MLRKILHYNFILSVLAVLSLGGCESGAEIATVIHQMGGVRQGMPLNLTTAVTTLAGTGKEVSVDGIGTAASLYNPYGITTDGSNLYVGEYRGSRIRKIAIASGVVTTLAGSGTVGAVDGIGTAASFHDPRGITTDGSSLYVSDTSNHKIRQIVITTGVVTTLAGSGKAGAVDGTGTSASFNMPSGITTDGSNLYVADISNNKIRKIVIASGVVTTLAGSGAEGAVDGPATAASFNHPNGITTDGSDLYVADFYNHKIRKIVIATGVVTTVAGTGTSGAVDGTGITASLNHPNSITTDGSNLYVADTFNYSIRQILITTGVVTTLAGSGTAGAVDGPGTAASFNTPAGIATDGSTLYVSDLSNNKIRKIQ